MPMGSQTESGLRPAVGDKLRLTVSDVAFGGEGVARHNDFVVFVPFVLQDEEVEAEVTELKKNFARARLLRVLRPSARRVTPRCRYFGECGGCQYQHIDYPAQLELKHRQIGDLLQRVGHLPAGLVSPVVPCPQPYSYRNRIMIRSQWDKFKKGLNIGYIRADNRLVVDIEECSIAEPALNQGIQQVRAHPPPKGGLKVVLRIPPEGWEVPPDSFFQNNFHLLPGLVQVIRDCLTQSGARWLLDAYCGVGFFSVELADLWDRFVGIEVDCAAIRAARHNAARRSRINGEFLPGRTEELLPHLLAQYPAPETALILDPPRTGCPPALLELLQQTRPAQVIYVSCHPATLARDLNVLCSQGVFELKKVVPLDMFPQTQHAECVADVRPARAVDATGSAAGPKQPPNPPNTASSPEPPKV